MKKIIAVGMASVLLAALLSGCAGTPPDTVDTDEQRTQSDVTMESWKAEEDMEQIDKVGDYTVDTQITDVLSDAAFGDYGRLIFPVDEGYYSGSTLGGLSLVWYSNIDPDKTVEICNYMRDHALAGDTIFYDIYTEEEKAADPAKRNTGLFFFKGSPGERFAVCNA